MIIQILKQPQKPVYSLNSCHIYSLLTFTAITGCCSSNASDEGNACIGWLSVLSLPWHLQLLRPKPAEMHDKTSCDLSALNFPPIRDTERATVADLMRELCRQCLNALLSGNSILVRCLKSSWVELRYDKHSTIQVFCKWIFSSCFIWFFFSITQYCFN